MAALTNTSYYWLHLKPVIITTTSLLSLAYRNLLSVALVISWFFLFVSKRNNYEIVSFWELPRYQLLAEQKKRIANKLLIGNNYNGNKQETEN